MFWFAYCCKVFMGFMWKRVPKIYYYSIDISVMNDFIYFIFSILIRCNFINMYSHVGKNFSVVLFYFGPLMIAWFEHITYLCLTFTDSTSVFQAEPLLFLFIYFVVLSLIFYIISFQYWYSMLVAIFGSDDSFTAKLGL